jgi:N-acetylglucosaminyl-diphospho-decaprenol L-rhamnosyltransferase
LVRRIPAPVISAIVVNWNGKDYLPACLDALLGQSPPPDEILVVDNHSDDGSREMVAARYPGVRVLDTGSNQGPCTARNLGVQQARHDLCLLVDNDVVLQPGALAALLATLRSDPKAALVQARSLCGDDPTKVHYDSADLHFLGTLVLHNWYRPVAQAPWPKGEVGAAIALCVLIQKQPYLAVGGFDPNLFILYEDNQLSYKLRMRGHSVRLAEGALCLHLAGTQGLSVRGKDAHYSGRRTFLHSRNRWYVLLTCMRWRTLILTLPMQLLYGVVYAGFGLLRGQLGDWWTGKMELLRLVPVALRQRAVVQQGRTVPDRVLLVASPLTLNPGLAEGGGKGALRRLLDSAFACWWRLVRGACG